MNKTFKSRFNSELNAAACACTQCLFVVQVMVCPTPHAFLIRTAGSQLPQGELHVFTKETDTKKLNREFTHFHLCFFFPHFDVCESGPGQGAEA